MTTPRPEFVTPSAKKWEHIERTPLHGERRAEPTRRRTYSSHKQGDEARTSRLVALVAGTYDGKQRRSTPARWLQAIEPDARQALELWESAQDARNRATVRTVYDRALPCPVIPGELAKRHAREFEKHAEGQAPLSHRMALEVLSMLDDPKALDDYLLALKAQIPEIEGYENSLRHARHLLEREATPQRLKRRPWIQYLTSTPTGAKMRRHRVSGAHFVAFSLCETVSHFVRNEGRTAVERGRGRRAREAQDRENFGRVVEGYAHGRTPPEGTVAYGRWWKLNPHFPERPVAHTGRCGRSRTATVTGKAPRFISRLLSDPERRIFSRTARGTKALVIVDLSGSMSLEADDIDRILESSVGATVVGYSADNNHEPNCQLLAHRGRRVRTVERWSNGNGVDAPAVVWACRRYATSSTPVLWVTDCQAVGKNGQTFEVLDECRKVAKFYGIRIERNVEHAVEALDDLRRGKRRPANPQSFSEVIEDKRLEPSTRGNL